MAAPRDKGDIEEGEEASVEWRVLGSAIRAVGAMLVVACGTQEEVVGKVVVGEYTAATVASWVRPSRTSSTGNGTI